MVTMTIFGCKFGFGNCSWAYSLFKHWAGCCWLSYKIHLSSHITIQLRNGSLLLHKIREGDTSKWWSFQFAVSSWGTHLSSFFTFSVCFKCQMTVEWLMLSSWATSCSCKRISFDDPFSWSLLISFFFQILFYFIIIFFTLQYCIGSLVTSDGKPLCSSS